MPSRDELDESSDNGAHLEARHSVLTLTYDHQTHQVVIGGSPLPMSLGQMILSEAMRLLEEQRRETHMALLARKAQEAARVQGILQHTLGRG